MAQQTQLSPYEPRSNIMDQLKARKNRDNHKTMMTNNLGAAVNSYSPRKRLVRGSINQINAYPKKKKVVKSRPGSNYESPYAARKLLAQTRTPINEMSALRSSLEQ